jgi:hypothetical protein
VFNGEVAFRLELNAQAYMRRTFVDLPTLFSVHAGQKLLKTPFSGRKNGITDDKPTYFYQYGVDECIGDHALTEKAVKSQLAAITCPRCRLYRQVH